MNAIAPTQGGNVVVYDVDLLADSQDCHQQFTKEEMTVPFLRIVQGTSPQLKENDPAYNINARAGMLANSASNELFDGKKGVALVRVYAQHSYIEWVPLNKGGGFVAEHKPVDGRRIITARDPSIQSMEIIQPDSPLGTPGNQLVETYTFYCLQLDLDAQTCTPVLVTMSSTSYKVAKRWNYLVQERKAQAAGGKVVTPPQWWDVYLLGSAIESNDQNSWYIPTLTKAAETLSLGEFGKAVYASAKQAFAGFNSGEAAIDTATSYAAEEATRSATATTQAAQPAQKRTEPATFDTDDEIPF